MKRSKKNGMRKSKMVSSSSSSSVSSNSDSSSSSDTNHLKHRKKQKSTNSEDDDERIKSSYHKRHHKTLKKSHSKKYPDQYLLRSTSPPAILTASAYDSYLHASLHKLSDEQQKKILYDRYDAKRYFMENSRIQNVDKYLDHRITDRTPDILSRSIDYDEETRYQMKLAAYMRYKQERENSHRATYDYPNQMDSTEYRKAIEYKYRLAAMQEKEHLLSYDKAVIPNYLSGDLKQSDHPFLELNKTDLHPKKKSNEVYQNLKITKFRDSPELNENDRDSFYQTQRSIELGNDYHNNKKEKDYKSKRYMESEEEAETHSPAIRYKGAESPVRFRSPIRSEREKTRIYLDHDDALPIKDYNIKKHFKTDEFFDEPYSNNRNKEYLRDLEVQKEKSSLGYNKSREQYGIGYPKDRYGITSGVDGLKDLEYAKISSKRGRDIERNLERYKDSVTDPIGASRNSVYGGATTGGAGPTGIRDYYMEGIRKMFEQNRPPSMVMIRDRLNNGDTTRHHLRPPMMINSMLNRLTSPRLPNVMGISRHLTPKENSIPTPNQYKWQKPTTTEPSTINKTSEKFVNKLNVPSKNDSICEYKTLSSTDADKTVVKSEPRNEELSDITDSETEDNLIAELTNENDEKVVIEKLDEERNNLCANEQNQQSEEGFVVLNEFSVIDELTDDINLEDVYEDFDFSDFPSDTSTEETVSRVSDILGVDWQCLVEDSKKSLSDISPNNGRWETRSILNRIGISLKYAGTDLYEEIKQELASAPNYDENTEEEDHNKCRGNVLFDTVANFHVRMKEINRQNKLVFEPYRKAVSSSKDLAIRRKLLKLPPSNLEIELPPQDSNFYCLINNK